MSGCVFQSLSGSLSHLGFLLSTMCCIMVFFQSLSGSLSHLGLAPWRWRAYRLFFSIPVGQPQPFRRGTHEEVTNIPLVFNPCRAASAIEAGRTQSDDA